MVGKFNGFLSGSEMREGKNGNYVIARFLEDNGKSFETMTRDTAIMQKVLSVPKLSKVDIEIDCIQGTYPRYDLKSITVK